MYPNDTVDYIIFHMEDGREIKVWETDGTFSQSGDTKENLIEPDFLQAFIDLLIEHDMCYAPQDEPTYEDNMPDHEADAQTLAMAGWGTNEDYHFIPDREDY